MTWDFHDEYKGNKMVYKNLQSVEESVFGQAPETQIVGSSKHT